MRANPHYTHSTALKALLELHHIDANGTAILRSMESPCLFLKREGRFIAGTAFLSPDWIDCYLRPTGCSLIKTALTRKEAPAFLYAHAPSVFLLPEQKALVISACTNDRATLKRPRCSTDQPLAMGSLLKKLPAEFTALTLAPCTPEPLDMRPLLVESVHTLAEYRDQLPVYLSKTVTRSDMTTLHTQYFSAFMHDLPNIAHLIPDSDVYAALLELAHIYQHLFINNEQEVTLHEILPFGLINRCITWLQELIIDRLHELGASDAVLEPLYALSRRHENRTC